MNYSANRNENIRREKQSSSARLRQKYFKVTYRFKCKLAHKMKLNPTPAESLLWDWIHDDETGFHFKQQRIIGPYILDFYCKSAKIAVEVDGGIHDRRKEYDASRDQSLLHIHGIRVIRFSNEQVMNDTMTVVASIVSECDSSVHPQPLKHRQQHPTERELRVLKRRLRHELQKSDITDELQEELSKG